MSYYKFPLGQVLTSPKVRVTLTKNQLVDVLRRHVFGDWHHDRRDTNEQAILDGARILSEFWVVGKDGQLRTLWIVTEEGRRRTFVMYPAECADHASDLDLDHEPYLSLQ